MTSQIRIMPPGEMTTPIVDITNVRVMSAATVLFGVQRKNTLFLSGVQGFVRTVLAVFISIAANDWRNVGASFESAVVQGIKHLFRIRKLGLTVRERAVVVLQIHVDMESINWNLPLPVLERYLQQFSLGVVVWAVASLVVTEDVLGLQSSTAR